MRKRIEAFARLLLVLAVTVPLAAAALDLDDAKARGLVGEDAGGYIAAVEARPSADVTALVDDVNTKRRAEYERIAKQNSLTLPQVEQIAGKKAIEKTAEGQYVRLPGEAWRKK